MPPPDPAPDPNAAPSGIQGLLGNFASNPAALYGGQLSDPATQQQMALRGLLSMAGSFADSAMPTRVPTPFGAVLGHAAAAAGTGEDAIMDARLKAAQAQQALAQSQLTQQDVETSKLIPGLLNQWNAAGAATPGAIPGTIGAPSASTVPTFTGRGPLGITIPPGTPTAAFDPKLTGTENINNLALAAAPIALPDGYTVKMTSGERPGATVAGTGGASQHATANAADFQIFGPDGKPIPNTGPDSTGYYGRLALTMRMIADPSIKPWLAWGGNFTTGGGEPDLMHFDFAGDRGHLGTLAAMEQNATPQNPSGAPPSTVRGSWFGNAPGWTDKNDRGLQANGQPVSAGPGIALPIPKDSPDFGKWYDVTAPNGKTLRLQQTDVGPGPEGKGRGVDVNAVAAGQYGYTPGSFPTDGSFRIAPAGQRPVQVASNAPVSDAGPTLPPGAVPGLLGPSGRTTAQLADQAMADRGLPAPAAAGPGPAGLLAPQPGGITGAGVSPYGPGQPTTGLAPSLAMTQQRPGAIPSAQPPGAQAPLSPDTIAILKRGGMTDEQIANVKNAPSAPPPAPPPVPPPGAAPQPGQPRPILGYEAPLPPGPPPPGPGPLTPPQSLVTPPQPEPPVPPIARPQPPAPPPQAPAGSPQAAPGTIPGAPSPERIALAQKIAMALTMMRRPVPPDIAATASFGLDIAKAGATAAATAPIEINKAIAIAQGTQPITQQNEAQKAQVTAQWNLWVDQNKPVLTRPNTLQIDPQTGKAFGNFEAVGPDGAMHRYIALPNGQKTDLGQSAISPFQTEGAKTVAQKNADDMATVNKDAAAAAMTQTQATNMRQEAKSFYTGPGAAYNQDLNKVLVALDPSNADRANKVASYESFIKDAGFLARDQARTLGTRTGVQELTQVANSLASPETSPRGLDRVMGQIQGLSDYKLAKQQAMNGYVNQPSRGGWDNNGFEAQFNANVSPYTFMYMRQSDQDRAETLQKLGKTPEGRADLQRLQGQIKYLTDNGLRPQY